MALAIAHRTDFGVDATYWRVGSYEVDLLGQKIRLMMIGYFDLAAFEAGAKPMAAVPMEFDGEHFQPEPKMKELEALAMVAPGWAGAAKVA